MEKPTNRGFTMVELMIVVVVVGILAAIAYPSYMQHTRAARRTDAYTALSQLANDMEKFYSDCGAYTDKIATTPRSCTAPAGPPAGTLGKSTNVSANGYYTLSITLPAGGYLLKATATGAQADDNDCQTLSLSSTGAKSATAGAGGNTARCWRN